MRHLDENEVIGHVLAQTGGGRTSGANPASG
jgi:hypothetical protein